MKIETQADIERLMAEQNISIVFRPCITEQRDGTWTARYPGAEWSVAGRDADEARELLHAEELKRMRDSTNSEWKVEAVRRYFTEGPIDGVYVLDKETTDHVINAEAPEALDVEIAAIDRRRAGDKKICPTEIYPTGKTAQGLSGVWQGTARACVVHLPYGIPTAC